MLPIDKKPVETPENNFYGVDVNNKEAVEKEFERLKYNESYRLSYMIGLLKTLNVDIKQIDNKVII